MKRRSLILSLLRYPIMIAQTARILSLCMALGLAVGVTLFLVIPKQYEAHALLDAGVAWNPASNSLDGFDTISRTVARVNALKKQVFEEQKGFVRPYRFRYLRTQADPANAGHLYLFLRAAEPLIAKTELSEILEETLQEDKHIFLARQDKLEETIQRKHDEWKYSVKKVRRIEYDVAAFVELGQFRHATLKWFEKEKIREEHIRLSNELNVLTKMSKGSHQSRLLVAPTLPSQPHSPGLHFLLSVGLSFGMIIGMVIISIRGTRNRDHVQTALG